MSVASETPVATFQRRTWLRRITTGGQIIESCPSWCTDSHANDHTDTSLDDLQHGTSLPGLDVQVSDYAGSTVPMPLLAPRIAVEPYSDDPARRVPHVMLEVWQDEYLPPMDAASAVAVIDAAQAHLGLVKRLIVRQLEAAQAEAGVI